MKKKTKSKKKPSKEKKINWHSIIALSAAGNYIANRLNEELKDIVNK